MAENPTWEEKLASYGRLACLFQPYQGCTTPYATLLYLHTPETASVVALIRDLLRSHADLDRDSVVLLQERDWRPLIVVATAAVLGLRTSLVVAGMWCAFDWCNWLSPQLAAALSIADPAFLESALNRLRRSPYGRSANSASALLELCRADHPDDPRVVETGRDGEIQRLIEKDTDSGGLIALQWRTRLLEIIQTLP